MTDDWDAMYAATKVAPEEFLVGALAQKFVIPPFTVLNTTLGDWQKRRRWWLAMGIQSELGRGEEDIRSNPVAASDMGAMRAQLGRRAAEERSNLTGAPDLPDYVTDGGGAGLARMAPGTSIFDPVVCELTYRWWCPPGGTVLDPFAGGSVRGIVAAVLGHPYTGIDLGAAQVAANRQQADDILAPHHPRPRWLVGDSAEVLADLPAGEVYDLVFTCPPYYDLEVYGTDAADLSALPSVAEFAAAFSDIMAKAVHRLRANRFAVVVMGEARHRRGPQQGHLYGLIPITIAAMEQAGAAFYNDAILVNSPGTLPIRVTKQFTASRGRKLGRQHQYVLVFVKGQPPTDEWEYQRTPPPDPQMGLLLDGQPEVLPLMPGPTPAEYAPPPPRDARMVEAAESDAQIQAILAGIYDVPLDAVARASARLDMKHATDWTVRVAGGPPVRVAARALGRYKRIRPDDRGMTVRLEGHGAPSELQKLCSGEADVYLLGWVEQGTATITDWVLVDMAEWRRLRVWERAEDHTNHEGHPYKYIHVTMLEPCITRSSRPVWAIRGGVEPVPEPEPEPAGSIELVPPVPLFPDLPPPPAVYIRCTKCGGTLLMVDGVRTCEDCGWQPGGAA